MFKFLSKKKGETSLIFNINAESVLVEVVLHEKNSLPYIVYTGKEYFFLNTPIDKSPRRLVSAMKKALHRADEYVRRNVLRHDLFASYPSIKVHFAFSSPWIETKTETLPASDFLEKEANQKSIEFAHKLSKKYGAPFVSMDYKTQSAIDSGDNTIITLHLCAVPKEIHDTVSSLYRVHSASAGNVLSVK